MEDKSGFYKQNEVGEWMYAPHFVYSANYELLRDKKDTYQYPVDGWYWFDDEPLPVTTTTTSSEYEIL